MNVLVSYWTLRTGAGLDRVETKTPDAHIFLDSGAYSAASSGKQIDVHAYAEWVLRNRHRVAIHSNLDVIGDAKGTERNQRILEEQYGLEPLPVFHIGSPWEKLDELCDRYDYIALGGIARPEYTAKRIMPWLIRCFRIAEGRAQFHGFGVTNWHMISTLPWKSVDSTTWQSGQRYGAPLLWGKGRLIQVVKHRLPLYEGDIRRMGFDPLQIRRAVAPNRSADDVLMMTELAIASYQKAERMLQERFNSNLRIYFAGWV